MKLGSIRIDVNKIDKERLFKGNKGTYLNLTIAINDEPDNYGNTIQVWEEQTKDERLAKANRNFLGSGKIVWEGESKAQDTAQAPVQDEDDGLPF